MFRKEGAAEKLPLPLAFGGVISPRQARQARYLLYTIGLDTASPLILYLK